MDWMMTLNKPEHVRANNLLARAKQEMAMRNQGPQNEIQQIARQVAKLQERIDSMERGESQLEDDLFHKLPHMCKKALKVIKDPPETWKPYLDQDDLDSIYKMETKELKRAMDKDGDVDKEITHVIAALLYKLLSDE